MLLTAPYLSPPLSLLAELQFGSEGLHAPGALFPDLLPVTGSHGPSAAPWDLSGSPLDGSLKGYCVPKDASTCLSPLSSHLHPSCVRLSATC